MAVETRLEQCGACGTLLDLVTGLCPECGAESVDSSKAATPTALPPPEEETAAAASAEAPVFLEFDDSPVPAPTPRPVPVAPEAVSGKVELEMPFFPADGPEPPVAIDFDDTPSAIAAALLPTPQAAVELSSAGDAGVSTEPPPVAVATVEPIDPDAPVMVSVLEIVDDDENDDLFDELGLEVPGDDPPPVRISGTGTPLAPPLDPDRVEQQLRERDIASAREMLARGQFDQSLALLRRVLRDAPDEAAAQDAVQQVRRAWLASLAPVPTAPVPTAAADMDFDLDEAFQVDAPSPVEPADVPASSPNPAGQQTVMMPVLEPAASPSPPPPTASAPTSITAAMKAPPGKAAAPPTSSMRSAPPPSASGPTGTVPMPRVGATGAIPRAGGTGAAAASRSQTMRAVGVGRSTTALPTAAVLPPARPRPAPTPLPVVIGGALLVAGAVLWLAMGSGSKAPRPRPAATSRPIPATTAPGPMADLPQALRLGIDEVLASYIGALEAQDAERLARVRPDLPEEERARRLRALAGAVNAAVDLRVVAVTGDGDTLQLELQRTNVVVGGPNDGRVTLRETLRLRREANGSFTPIPSP